MTSLPDSRLNAYRPDLAETALKGVVAAERYTDGRTASIALPVVDLRPRPDATVGIDTQLLLGEPVTVLDRAGGWAWVKSGLDAYVGYLPETAIDADVPSPTHIVTAPRSFVYSGADLRFPMRRALSMGARLVVTGEAETRGTRYLLLAGGEAVIANHCALLDTAFDGDYVAIAARFLETPYLWGGRSGFGIDCSGLVQLAMMMAGRPAPRDSDMQAKGLGTPIDRSDLARGDLVFWKGHVAIVEDPDTILHANGHTMSVAREGLTAAIERIRWLYAEPTGYRRP
ncbi:Cell wall-associated hydrolase, NlpC family [Rhizobium sp. RU20A]|uniref:C40 family peptidase n=1 Tax=Rhizobium sp. RU20A TaxID=1907412 RepID=UPI000954C459|nr:NlpC/P60 family protein [Rhizobium sp. RU20A]SIQ77256.1 Cell wall-associated hydrolase, NlpC family [Rhizobium sp. RU20A]